MDGSFLCMLALAVLLALSCFEHSGAVQLRFNSNGEFKIIQVSDMHYANGAQTSCLGVTEEEFATCSDLNTTAFLRRMIEGEKPDLIVFTGDNISQRDSLNTTASLLAAFAPAIEAKIPWAAILGDSDQDMKDAINADKKMSRSEVMAFVVQMNYTVSQMNPDFTIGERKTVDGFGNYNLEVAGAAGTDFENKSVLNLYMIDSGDFTRDDSALQALSLMDWIKPSQLVWLEGTSAKLQRAYKEEPVLRFVSAPALVFHHIPVPEAFSMNETDVTGDFNANDSETTEINSGLLPTLINMGDVKAAFTGHNHLNDFCGYPPKVYSVALCHGGVFGYHSYSGHGGRPRRSRVITAYLTQELGNWRDVDNIATWKRLDDANFSKIDEQILYQYEYFRRP